MLQALHLSYILLLCSVTAFFVIPGYVYVLYVCCGDLLVELCYECCEQRYVLQRVGLLYI
jgi:hypothetical protein